MSTIPDNIIAPGIRFVENISDKKNRFYNYDEYKNQTLGKHMLGVSRKESKFANYTPPKSFKMPTASNCVDEFGHMNALGVQLLDQAVLGDGGFTPVFDQKACFKDQGDICYRRRIIQDKQKIGEYITKEPIKDEFFFIDVRNSESLTANERIDQQTGGRCKENEIPGKCECGCRYNVSLSRFQLSSGKKKDGTYFVLDMPTGNVYAITPCELTNRDSADLAKKLLPEA